MGAGLVGVRRRWALVIAGVVVLLVAAGCWTLTASLLAPGQNGAERANVYALPIAILSLLATVASIWLTLRGLRPKPDADRVARDLARAVRVERQRFLDQALAVAWTARPARIRFGDPVAAGLSEPVEAMLLQWQAISGVEAGSIEEVAEFYTQQPSGRLVVLGAPGAGKTVLLSRLVLDLLDHVEATGVGDSPLRGPIPVLLSLPSCDLGDRHDSSSDQLADRLQAWITCRLVEDYGLRRARAVALVHAGQVLPVLDGLDEMDPTPTQATTAAVPRSRARAVLRALNAPGRFPVVLACRQLDYNEISQPAPGHADGVSILTDAQHVTLRPLDATDVIGYLTDRFHGRDGGLRPRWQPVADALDTGDPLTQILANPWQLFLAVTAYTAENSDPADLLTMSPDHAETHLLANLIPAVVEHNDTAARHDWTPERVTRWLSTIADYQYRVATERGSSLTDIQLPDLWRITRRRHPRWVPPLVTAIPMLAIGVGVQLVEIDLIGRITGVLIMLGAVVLGFIAFGSASPMQRLNLAVARTPRGRRYLRDSLRGGLAKGLVSGLAYMLAVELVGGPGAGLGAGLPVGLALGLTLGLVRGLTVNVETVLSATALVRQCITYSLGVGLTVGLAVGLVFGLVVGLAFGLMSGLAFGLMSGLAHGNGIVWLRYVLGVRAAARQGTLPGRPARFFDWCLDTGLMRMAGNSIQFRHRQLQDWISLLSRK